MDGVMVAYHDTKKIFGFEYLRREQMEACIFETPEMAETSFVVSANIFRFIVEKVLQECDPQGDTLEVLLKTITHSHNHDTGLNTEIAVYVLRVPKAEDKGWCEEELVTPPSKESIKGRIKRFKLRIATQLDGETTVGPLLLQSGDDVDVFIQWSENAATNLEGPFLEAYRASLGLGGEEEPPSDAAVSEEKTLFKHFKSLFLVNMVATCLLQSSKEHLSQKELYSSFKKSPLMSKYQTLLELVDGEEAVPAKYYDKFFSAHLSSAIITRMKYSKYRLLKKVKVHGEYRYTVDSKHKPKLEEWYKKATKTEAQHLLQEFVDTPIPKLPPESPQKQKSQNPNARLAGRE